jgi:type I restriction enzyme M protein
MYRIDRNNFYLENKNASIQTPDWVSNFLFELLSPHIKKEGIVFDPCVGKGSLLKPWKEKGYQTQGVDIKEQGFENTKCQNYLTIKKRKVEKSPKYVPKLDVSVCQGQLIIKKEERLNVSLVIMNPPFNIDETTETYIKKNYSSRPLLPEVWLQKTIELFGKNIPIIMFTPYGFRLNQSRDSKRWKCFFNGEYPPITSIISLPKDVFQNVLFHSEILVFNLPNLKGHYFCGERIT